MVDFGLSGAAKDPLMIIAIAIIINDLRSLTWPRSARLLN